MSTYFASTCVYIVFIAHSFHDVCNYNFDLSWDVRIYIVLTCIPLLFLSQIRKIKHLVPFSACANVFVIITFAITLYFLFNEKLDFSDKPLAVEISKFPMFFATAIFAMEGIGALMPVENSMKKPQQFISCPGVLCISMTIVITLYTIIGFFGYVRYGEDVLGSITLNLEPGSM